MYRKSKKATSSATCLLWRLDANMVISVVRNTQQQSSKQPVIILQTRILQDDSDALSSANAGAANRIPLLGPHQLVGEVSENARSRCSQRMA